MTVIVVQQCDCLCCVTCKPELTSLKYMVPSQWHNRDQFFSGREEIVKFLTKKWEMELDYRLVKELW